MPVASERTSRTSSSVTLARSSRLEDSHAALSPSSRILSLRTLSRTSAASSIILRGYQGELILGQASNLDLYFRELRRFSGPPIFLSAPASSSRSIALSGRKRSET